VNFRQFFAFSLKVEKGRKDRDRLLVFGGIAPQEFLTFDQVFS
jgi:hypothetical protein